MFIQHASSDTLTTRLDASFYNPLGLKTHKKILSFGNCFELSEIVNPSRPITNGVRGPSLEPSKYHLVRLQDCQNWVVRFDNCLTISEQQFKENKRCKLKVGDIVVAIGGYVGNASIVSDEQDAVIGQHSAVLSANPTVFDSHFLVAYLNTSLAENTFQRYVSGTVQAGINLEDLRSIIVPLPLSMGVQTYIGNKVRQAELLTVWAKQLLSQANYEFEESILWDSRVVKKVKFGRVSRSKLENRLDHRFNSIEKFKAIDLLVENNIKLEQLENVYGITAMVGWKGLTTEHYVDDGPWLLRGVEFSDGVIDFDNLVMVERDKYLEQPQIHLKEGDVALSKDGTIGKAIVIPKINREFAVGSTIARLRQIDETLDPYYLEHCLNHDFLQVQVESYATGVAQPHITQEWIAKLLIPRVANEQEISTLIFKHHLAMNLAKALTNSSKWLVEALIEGQVTESQLTEAQQALEDGDNTKDRAILSKINYKGYLAEGGKPMFTDLDKLYELLDEAKAAEDANEESV